MSKNSALDCYVGPDDGAEFVYIVRQMKAPEFQEFDEYKAMLGFATRAQAVKAYLAHYDDPRFLGSVATMPFEEFKEKALRTLDKPKLIKSTSNSGDIGGVAYPGHHPDRPVSSGGSMVDRDKLQRFEGEHIVDVSEFMEAVEALLRDSQLAERPRITLDVSKLDPQQFKPRPVANPFVDDYLLDVARDTRSDVAKNRSFHEELVEARERGKEAARAAVRWFPPWKR